MKSTQRTLALIKLLATLNAVNHKVCAEATHIVIIRQYSYSMSSTSSYMYLPYSWSKDNLTKREIAVDALIALLAVTSMVALFSLSILGTGYGLYFIVQGIASLFLS